MPREYMGKAYKWARNETQALSFLCRGKPDKQGFCTHKKGARLKIISVKCISLPTESKNIEKDTSQDSAPFFLES